jgi:hypothetical protein
MPVNSPHSRICIKNLPVSSYSIPPQQTPVSSSVARWPKFRPKISKEAGEKLSWPEEFVAEFWPNITKSGRKWAGEYFLFLNFLI